jgi:hypothetical protein
MVFTFYARFPSGFGDSRANLATVFSRLAPGSELGCAIFPLSGTICPHLGLEFGVIAERFGGLRVWRSGPGLAILGWGVLGWLDRKAPRCAQARHIASSKGKSGKEAASGYESQRWRDLRHVVKECPGGGRKLTSA